MTERIKDLMFVGVSAVISLIVAQVIVEERYEAAAFFGLWLGSAMVLKAVMPMMTSVQRVSWSDLIVTLIVAVVCALLLFNADVLGGWALVATFGLAFAYGLWRLAVIARRGDGQIF